MTTIENVHGRVNETLGDELLAFWTAHGALTGDQARSRVPEVVCVLRGDDGAIAGVCSVASAAVPLVAEQRFWIYRSLLPGDAAEHRGAMIRAAYDALNAEYDATPGAEIGLCVLLAGPEERARRSDAVWSEPRMVYAGYLDDGRQVRIGYFEDAVLDLEAMR